MLGRAQASQPLGLGRPRPPWNTVTTTARFRCIDAHAGLRCTLPEGGAGFLFDKHGRAHRITKGLPTAPATAGRG
jgi:hypothetical protein